MVEQNNKEYVILMKLVINKDQTLEFIPTKVITGTYIEDENVFVNRKTGNSYSHMSEALLCSDFANYNNVLFYAFRTDEKILKESNIFKIEKSSVEME